MAFADELLLKYRALLPRLGHGQSELNERVAWADVMLEGILGYHRADGDYEIEQLGIRRDIPVRNAANDPVIVVETKRSEVGLMAADEDQAFGYAVPATQYLILTDSKRIRLFRNTPDRLMLADLDMVALCARPRDRENGEYHLALSDRAALAQFRYLTRDELWEPRYDDFVGPFRQRRSVVNSTAFDAMIGTLDTCVEYLYLYALQTFDHFVLEAQRFGEDEERLNREATALRATGDELGAARIGLELRQRSRVALPYTNFRKDFDLWRRLSNRENRTPDENKDVFCKESVYVQLNKLLFVRICEDKGLLARKVSDGGVVAWRDLTTYLRDSYRDLIALAFLDAVRLYRHLFAEGVFDWYLAGDGDLNATLNRVLWRLNLYDFAGVDRDILGKLYEKYFPRDLRKTLGEFYTHETVVDFILDAVAYRADRDLRGITVLDPACGSGTFLVRALSRLLRSLDRRGIPPEERLRQATTNLTGFDINPFACAIAEMNLVFQLIDDYAQTGRRAGNLPRVPVYQTDSLLPSGRNGANGTTAYNLSLSDTLAPGGSALIAERDAVDNAKAKRYDVIVGNPPYVVTSNRAYRDWYADIVSGGANTYRYFLRAYLPLLKEDGRLGFIVPNTWLADEDSRAFRQWLLENFRLERILSLPYYVRAFYRVDQATTILVARPTRVDDGDAYPLTVGEARALDELAHDTYRRIETTLDTVVADDERYGLHQSIAIQPVPGAYAVLRRMRDSGFPTLVPNVVTAIYNGELGQHERRQMYSSPGANRAISLRGQNIYPYFIDTTPERRKAQWYDYSSPIERDAHAMQPRLVIMSRARQTQVKRIKGGSVDPSSLPEGRIYCDSRGMNYVLASDSRFPMEYVEGLLSSAPVNFYFKAYSASNQVNSADLARLPVPLPNAENDALVQAMIAAVQRMRGLHTARDDARVRVGTPLAGIDDLVPLYQSPLISGFPPDTVVGASVDALEDRVTLANGAFTCVDAATATLLAAVLRSLPPATALADVRFPRAPEVVTATLAALDAARAALATFQGNYAALDREIDDYAYALYGIHDARAVVEESLRTARTDESENDEDAEP